MPATIHKARFFLTVALAASVAGVPSLYAQPRDGGDHGTRDPAPERRSPERPHDRDRERPRADSPGDGEFHRERGDRMRNRFNEVEDLGALHRFLSLPPERLAEIRKTIEYIEAMTSEEREALRNRVSALRESQIELLRLTREGLEALPPEEKIVLNDYWTGLDADERMRQRKRVAQMEPEERYQFFRSIIESRAPARELTPEEIQLRQRIREEIRARRDRLAQLRDALRDPGANDPDDTDDTAIVIQPDSQSP